MIWLPVYLGLFVSLYGIVAIIIVAIKNRKGKIKNENNRTTPRN